jgi:hypothetical protein
MRKHADIALALDDLSNALTGKKLEQIAHAIHHVYSVTKLTEMSEDRKDFAELKLSELVRKIIGQAKDDTKLMEKTGHQFITAYIDVVQKFKQISQTICVIFNYLAIPCTSSTANEMPHAAITKIFDSALCHDNPDFHEYAATQFYSALLLNENLQQHEELRRWITCITKLEKDAGAKLDAMHSKEILDSSERYDFEFIQRIMNIAKIYERVMGTIATLKPKIAIPRTPLHHYSRICGNTIATREKEFAKLLTEHILQNDAARIKVICDFVCAEPAHVVLLSNMVATHLVDATFQDTPALTGEQIVAAHDKTLELVTRFPSPLFCAPCMSALRMHWKNKLRSTKKCTATLVGEYCNHVARTLSRNSASDVDSVFEKIVDVAVLLPDCDLFLELCEVGLAKRLFARGEVQPSDNLLLRHLRVACGKSMTRNIETMLNDASLWGSDLNLGTMTMKPLVCNSMHWPKIPIMQTSQNPAWLADIFKDAIIAFDTVYQKSHKSKKLCWAHAASTCKVQAWTTWKSPKTLQCSPCQASILLLFNAADHVVPSVHQDTAFALGGLTEAGVLKMAGDGYILNPHFAKSPEFTRVPLGPLRDSTAAEKTSIDCNLSAERTAIAQCCLTRIMKCHKTYDFKQLKEDAIHQLSSRFTPDVVFIKRQIEELIGNNYIRRDETVPTTLHYIA